MVFNFKLTVLNNSTLESIPQWRIQEFYNQSALSWLGRILRGGEIVLMPFNIQPIFCSESREWKQNGFWLQLMYVHVSKFTTTNAKKTPTNKKKGGGRRGRCAGLGFSFDLYHNIHSFSICIWSPETEIHFLTRIEYKFIFYLFQFIHLFDCDVLNKLNRFFKNVLISTFKQA